MQENGRGNCRPPRQERSCERNDNAAVGDSPYGLVEVERSDVSSRALSFWIVDVVTREETGTLDDSLYSYDVPSSKRLLRLST